VRGTKRRVLGIAALTICLAAVVGYQLSRPVAAGGDAAVYVPAPKVFKKLPPSWRVTVADVYWLYLIQYYGEHYSGDYQFDSLPELIDLVTTLSPKWERPYIFAAYALLDVNGGKGLPELSYDYLLRGYEANPRDWGFPFNLAIFAYWMGDRLPQLAGKDPNEVAGQWMEKAAALPGSPAASSRLAASLYGRGDNRGKAMSMWAQVYDTGDEYARKKAVYALGELLPAEPAAREAALGELSALMTADGYASLVRALDAAAK
jgi:hypothetical protein